MKDFPVIKGSSYTLAFTPDMIMHSGTTVNGPAKVGSPAVTVSAARPEASASAAPRSTTTFSAPCSSLIFKTLF